MVALMLNTACKEPVCRQCTPSAAPICILHRHTLRAFHITVDLRYGEAALRVHDAALAHRDDRIHQLEKPVLILHINDDQAQRLSDLRSGKPHAVGRVHRLCHIVEHLPMPFRQALDRLCFLFQDGVSRLFDL